MKDDVIMFLAAGALLGGTNLYFPMEQYIYRRKSGGVYIRNPKRTWEKLLNLRQRAELQFAATTSLASLLEPPPTRPRQLPGAKTPGSYDPRADRQPLPEAYSEVLGSAVQNSRLEEVLGKMVKGQRYPGLIPGKKIPNTEEIKREEQAAAEQALTKEDFTMNGSLQQLSATLLDLRCWPSPQAGRSPWGLLTRPGSRQEAAAPLGRSAPVTPLAALRLGQRAERPPSLSWDQRFCALKHNTAAVISSHFHCCQSLVNPAFRIKRSCWLTRLKSIL
ncbi:PREDICTED: 40S ribosomal protein SA-like [Bison bison bison]|uniref:40S ribosomal protein SA-like n=1 Tax=Bison bison bison TaxID=43346 RepID=A0A6P3GMF2_BISBB|nr:PREDICTED: 40S ribosomal protein SA-like [Bison bison bison]